MNTLADLEIENEIAVLFVSKHGIVTRVNHAFERLFGWASTEIIGKPLTTIIPPSLREAHQAGFSRLLTTGQPRLLNQPIRLKAIDKNGHEFMAEHLIIGELRNAEWFFGAMIRRVEPR